MPGLMVFAAHESHSELLVAGILKKAMRRDLLVHVRSHAAAPEGIVRVWSDVDVDGQAQVTFEVHTSDRDWLERIMGTFEHGGGGFQQMARVPFLGGKPQVFEAN